MKTKFIDLYFICDPDEISKNEHSYLSNDPKNCLVLEAPKLFLILTRRVELEWHQQQGFQGLWIEKRYGIKL